MERVIKERKKITGQTDSEIISKCSKILVHIHYTLSFLFAHWTDMLANFSCKILNESLEHTIIVHTIHFILILLIIKSAVFDKYIVLLFFTSNKIVRISILEFEISHKA
jgi:hypothetical protein